VRERACVRACTRAWAMHTRACHTKRTPQGCMQSTSSPAAPPATRPPSQHSISVVFVDKEGQEQVVLAPVGKNLLEVAHDNEIDLEGGACS